MNVKPLLISLTLLGVALGCSRPEPGSNSQRGSRTIIQNKGSDTLVNVAQAWAENYKSVDPTVGIAVAGGGSGTGVSALINGTVDLANASRKMKTKELELARSKGIDPVEWVVGFDALAVYVHLSNPIESITLEQLAAIYGEGGSVEKWGDLSVAIPGNAEGEIIRVSRQNNSGTFVYFKKAVLGKKGDEGYHK